MTIEAAQKELTKVRAKQRKLVERSRVLRDFIDANGGHSGYWPDQTERNKAIYKAWKKGASVKSLASQYNLVPNTIHNICRRLDRKR